MVSSDIAGRGSRNKVANRKQSCVYERTGGEGFLWRIKDITNTVFLVYNDNGGGNLERDFSSSRALEMLSEKLFIRSLICCL